MFSPVLTLPSRDDLTASLPEYGRHKPNLATKISRSTCSCKPPGHMELDSGFRKEADLSTRPGPSFQLATSLSPRDTAGNTAYETYQLQLPRLGVFSTR